VRLVEHITDTSNRVDTEGLRAAGESAGRVMEAFEISNADNYPEIIQKRLNECELLDDKEKSELLSSVQDNDWRRLRHEFPLLVELY